MGTSRTVSGVALEYRLARGHVRTRDAGQRNRGCASKCEYPGRPAMTEWALRP